MRRPDWPGMFKAVAEAWNWTPEQIGELTPMQLIHLTGTASASAGGKIDVTDPAAFAHWTKWWMEQNSPETLLRKAERRLAREIAYGMPGSPPG